MRESRSHAVAWCLFVALILTGFCIYQGVTGVLHIMDSWTESLPRIDNSETFNFAQESYMYASDGTTLLAEFQLEKRDPVSLKDISDYVVRGTIDVEDSRFYEHDGVDPLGIVRALVRNLRGGQLEGASTITQQLVRNTVLSEEATDITLERKVREAELATRMEDRYSKDEILTMYLNTINYGDGCYGIEAAAQNYFQISAGDLSLVQAATLVGIPQSPTRLNPKAFPEECRARRNDVLARMLVMGDITQEEYDGAVAEPLELDPEPPAPYQGIYAYPYFTSFVRDQLLKENNPYNCSYAELFEGGLTITTTLDIRLQDAAEQACADQYASMAEGLDASLVAMDPQTGYVQALVGGQDYETDQWNIATQGGRPAGSAFKVFTLVTAIEQGISPQTRIDCSNPYRLPNGTTIENFASIDYRVRSIQSATAVSANTGYYRLAEKVTPSSIIQTAHKMGITSDLANLPIITLGTENVTPLEMATAYNTLASGGIHRDPVIITKIENAEGEVLYEAEDTGKRVIEEEVAGATTKVLRQVFESSEGTAYGQGPANGQPVAGKTGTGVQFRDHWLVGYCPTLTCAVWIGNRDYSQTSESLTAEPLWRNFMTRALDGTPITDFPQVKDPKYTNAFNPEQNARYSSQNDNDPKDAPNVVGKTRSEATALLIGYSVTFESQPSDQPEGTVIGQSVSGKNVVLVISSGPGEESEPEPEPTPEPTPDPEAPPGTGP